MDKETALEAVIPAEMQILAELAKSPMEHPFASVRKEPVAQITEFIAMELNPARTAFVPVLETHVAIVHVPNLHINVHVQPQPALLPAPLLELRN